MATWHSAFMLWRLAQRMPRSARGPVRTLAMGAALFAATSALTPVSAQSLCGSRGMILERLEGTFGEKRQAIGLSADGGVLEILASSNGSWTILVTHPGRPTCMLATGQAWENLALLLVGKPA